MPVKAVLTGIILIIAITLMVNFVEYFVPLSVKADLDMLCRNTLLKMENDGGLSNAERQALMSELSKIGLTGITIEAAASARLGSPLTLHVEGDFTYDRVTALFKRSPVKLRMVYKKTAMSRKVVN